MTRASGVVAAVLALVLGACGAPPTARGGASEAEPRRATAEAMMRTGESLRGRASSDVAAVLGPGTRIRFDSGYEVWVYRFLEPARRERAPVHGNVRAGRGAEAEGEALSELVLLFSPAGTLDRARVRSPSS